MSEVNKVKRKGKQPRQNVSGVSESALQAFSTVFAGGGGHQGSVLELMRRLLSLYLGKRH